MAPTNTSNTTSNSGIKTTEAGSFIPSSTRADGSVRKEIRVRPGYRPPEDIEVYKNRTADGFRSRGKGGGVPGAEFIGGDENRKPKGAGAKKGTAGGKPKAKESKETGPANGTTVKKEEEQKPKEPVDPEVEKEKEAKKLTKRLRQARDLKQKKEEGGALLPEQLDKVIKISELLRQLDLLGFDGDGEKKGGSSNTAGTKVDEDG